MTQGAPDGQPMFILGMMDYTTIPQWIVHHRAARRSTQFDDARRFRAFQEKVLALAA
jgi:hypothetical protein